MSTQPLAYVHDKEIVFVEQNNLPHKKNGSSFFSSFKVFKLKGPIDEISLYDVIFPDGKKDFRIETFNYTGESTKVKFHFTNKTHLDLVKALQNAASNLKHFSENGLLDWFATDSMTLKTIFPSINDQNLLSSSTTPQNDEDLDVSNYQIIDEEKLRADIKSLSEDLKLKRQNYSDKIFDQLFYDTFRRRNMNVSLNDLRSEFFSQLDLVHCFLGNNKETYESNDNNLLCPDQIKDTMIRYMFKTLEFHLFDSQVSSVYPKDCKLGLVIFLWNLKVTIYSIYESYQELKSADQSVKAILEEEKPKFRNMASNMEICVSDILNILKLDDGDDNILQAQYTKLKGRLSLFCEATISLLELVKYISIKCDEQIKNLEGQNQSLTTKLIVGACTLAFTVGTGLLYAYTKSSNNDSRDDKSKSFEKYAKVGAIATAAAAGSLTIGSGMYVRSDLQSTISRLTDTLKQLRDLHDQLKDWSFHGQNYLNRDYEEICEYKLHLLSLFSDIKEQCKKLDLALEY
ncbi:22043_t:CDS:2 [Dentiscutata erythropus]|uniref:22043_t:CDS:1 n=1 Tax=Dentiscutata erythropus TaxID=1348616 RepID=A0A9N9NJ62_9GLOM|nr:22043_t:CDS:2 [Dentiscutata erythropus]